MLTLLSEVGGPADVAANADTARALMWSTSRGKVSRERIESIVESARTTVGVVALSEERDALVAVAAEARRLQRELRRAEKRVEGLSCELVPKELPAAIGKTTAAVVVAETGDPSSYGSARAFVKACGLNLREKRGAARSTASCT